MENVTISTDKSLLDIALIHRFLSQEAYWSRGIPIQTVEQAIAHSLNFGAYENDRQVGYARVITDYTTIAYLGDVFVVNEHRGKGISKLMMQSITDHAALQGLRRWILLTADAHGLYRQFGWKEIANPTRWMEKHTPNIYGTPI